MSKASDLGVNGIRPAWEHNSIETGSASAIMRRYFVHEEWGDPVAANAWFEQTWHSEYDFSERLRALVCDYSNGRRADLRLSGRGSYVLVRGHIPASAAGARSAETSSGSGPQDRQSGDV
jgi:hypothetical protein